MNFRRHLPLFFVVLLTLVIAGSFLVVHDVYAQAAASAAEEGGSWIPGVDALKSGLNSIVAGLKAYFTEAMSWPLDILNAIAIALAGLVSYLLFFFAGWNDFVENPVVTIGWMAVRDVANLFFILILLFIAISTILGSEKLHYKQHLMRLLMMAIVINFSKMITGLLIDASQIVMLTFLAPIRESGPGALLSNLGNLALGKISRIVNAVKTGEFSIVDTLMAKVTDLMFLVISTVVMGVMAIMLMFRVVMLWILIILSPFAYVLSTFPQGEKYAGQWWGELTKYLLNGPVLAFFLWLGLTVNVGSSVFGGKEKLAQNFGELTSLDAQAPNVGIGAAGEPSNITKLLLSAAFLLAGTKIAGEIGGAGAGIVARAPEFSKEAGAFLARKIKAGKVPGMGKGWDLNPMNMVRSVKADWARQKTADEVKGMGFAGGEEGLKGGGVMGLLKGGLGVSGEVSRLFGDFTEGKGYKRLWQIATGGPEAVKKAEEEAKEESQKVALAQKLLEGGDPLSRGKQEKVKEQMESKEIKDEIQKSVDKTVQKAREDKQKERIRPSTSEERKDDINAEIEKELKEIRKEAEAFLTPKFQARQERLMEQKIGKAGEKDKDGKETEAGKAGDTLVKETKEKGIEAFKKDIKENEDEQQRIKDGGLTNDQHSKQLRHIADINERMQRLLKDIKKKNALGQDTRAEEAARDDLVKQMQANGATVDKDFKGTLADRATLKIASLKIPEKDMKAMVDAKDKRKKELEDEHTVMEARNNIVSDADREKEVSKLLGGTDENPITMKMAQEKINALNKKARESRGPEAYEALAHRRSLINEEKNKITTTNEDELIDLYNDAKDIGDPIRAAAIVMRATEVGHLNEIVNDIGGESNVLGLQKLIKEDFEGKLGFSKQEALSIANDISNGAEAQNHWMFSQAVGSKNGMLEFRDFDTQQTRQYTEMSKRGIGNLLKQGNRLAWGTEEWVDPNDRSKGRKWEPSPLLIRALSDNAAGAVFDIGRGNFNSNLMLNMRGKISLEMIRKMSLDPEIQKNVTWREGRASSLASVHSALSGKGSEGQTGEWTGTGIKELLGRVKGAMGRQGYGR